MGFNSEFKGLKLLARKQMKEISAEKSNYLQMLCECLKKRLMNTWILEGKNQLCKIPFLIPETSQWSVISLEWQQFLKCISKSKKNV